MIIDCISDLHGYFPKMLGGDLLVIAGDLTARGSIQEYISVLDWIKAQDYRKKVFIAGNHDGFLRDNKIFVKTYLYSTNKDCEYLFDSGTQFEGKRIWGTPWIPLIPHASSHCRYFTLGEDNLCTMRKSIPNNLDVLICHGPPKTILDKTKLGEHVGCQYLKEAIREKKPRVLIFGHIHECGEQILEVGDTVCVNCSIVNEYYQHKFLPLRIEI